MSTADKIDLLRELLANDSEIIRLLRLLQLKDNHLAIDDAESLDHMRLIVKEWLCQIILVSK